MNARDQVAGGLPNKEDSLRCQLAQNNSNRQGYQELHQLIRERKEGEKAILRKKKDKISMNVIYLIIVLCLRYKLN